MSLLESISGALGGVKKGMDVVGGLRDLVGGQGGDIALAAGQGISSAAGKAARDRLGQEELSIGAFGKNIAGRSAYETELLNRARLDEMQRQESLKNIYRESAALSPRVSPFDPSGGPSLSPAYMQSIGQLSRQGQETIGWPPTPLPALPAFTPLDIKNLQQATGQEPSTLARIGEVAGPSLSTLGMIMKLLGGRKPGIESGEPVDTTYATVPDLRGGGDYGGDYNAYEG